MDSESFNEINFDLQKKICRSIDNIKFTNYPLDHVPNQNLDTLNINNDGFRGPEIKKINEYGFRIFLVGGSTVMSATSTSDKTTISGFLEENFKKSGFENVEVINAGLGGAFSFSELNLIKNKIVNFKPDLVIVYDGWNDITRPLYGYQLDAIDYDPMTDFQRKYLIKNDVIRFPQFIYKYYNFWKYDQVDFVVKFDDENMEQKANLFKSSIEEMCKIGEDNNFNLIHILQPLVGSGSKKLTNEELHYFKRYDMEKLLKNYEIYAMKQKELKNKCSKIVDFRNIFDDITFTIYHDSGHYGDVGAEILAKRMFEISLEYVQ